MTSGPVIKPIIIAVVGDSLPLPRQFQGLEFHQTYPYLLADWLRKCGTPVEVWTAARAGMPVSKVAQTYADYRTYVGQHAQGIGILHLGIVDCTPRPVPLAVRNIIGKMPTVLRDLIVKFLHNYRVPILKYGPEFVFTKPQAFRRQYQDLLGKMAQDFGHVFAVNIIPPGSGFESRSPGVGQKARNYNQIIAEAAGSISGATLIDIWEVCQHWGGLATLVSSFDGHHLSPTGHYQVFQMIAAEYEKQCRASLTVGRVG